MSVHLVRFSTGSYGSRVRTFLLGLSQQKVQTQTLNRLLRAPSSDQNSTIGPRDTHLSIRWSRLVVVAINRRKLNIKCDREGV
jgi:hypothetical protein